MAQSTAQRQATWRRRHPVAARVSAREGQQRAGLEQQLAAESRFKPARAISAGITGEQRSEVTEAVAAGGVVTISGGALGARDPAG